MPKIITVGGVHGVGKTTSAKLATESLKRTGQVAYVSVGDELAAYAKSRFGKRIKQLTMPQMMTGWHKVLEGINRKKSKVVIVDQHYTFLPRGSKNQIDLLSRRRQFESTVPEQVHYVLLEAPLSEVLRRRAAGSKQRSTDPKGIAREIVGQRICARLEARETGKPLTIIRNSAGKQDETVRRIAAIVRRHL
ncbi:MAG: AAA family ATPase [Candidatus Micrarchaeota archaeon]|nr:AAA family ATPase [Candidatus Micrarchaeota archaeon]